MEPEDQHRAVEMLIGQIKECEASPTIATMMIQEMTMMGGTVVSVGVQQRFDVCETHFWQLIELVMDPKVIENFKKWYAIQQEKRKAAART